MTREVLVILHAGRATNLRTAAEVAMQFAAHGIRLRAIEEEWAEVIPTDLPAEMRPRIVEGRPGCAEGAEVVLVLGGDGTVLRAAELARPTRGAAAGRQPRPLRVPRRGGAGDSSPGPSTRSPAGTTRSRNG